MNHANCAVAAEAHVAQRCGAANGGCHSHKRAAEKDRQWPWEMARPTWGKNAWVWSNEVR